jgi:3-oxoacyl-[acyl-carrier protein] reductase
VRNVVVTGGTRGLGLAIATRLAADGYQVIAVARSESSEFRAQRQIFAAGSTGQLAFEACDLSDLDAIPLLVSSISKQFGPWYGLVNNAGLGTAGMLATMPVTVIESLLRLNVASPIVMTKNAVRKMMAKGGGGRIVNISSIVASSGFNGLSAYAATKAALQGFTRSLARELGPLQITVNCVAPGFVSTELTKDLSDIDRVKIASRSALRRLAEAQDVADAVRYLMSEGARNVTGTVLTVDAGGTA